MKKVARFEKILFQSPPPWKSVLLILISTFLYGAVLRLDLGVGGFYGILYASIVLFAVPSLIYGLISSVSVKNFYRGRAFLLSFINQTFLFLSLISINLDPSVSLFLLGFLYSLNILSLIAASSEKGPLPLLFPLLYFIPVGYLLSHYGIFAVSQIRIISFLCLGIATWISVRIVDYFLSLNMPEISAVSLLSSFINGEPRKIGGGKPVSVLLNAIDFRGPDDFIVVVPWLHPGPMGSIGGGSMSPSIIEKLNSNGSGYFWHVPTSHEDNPTDPAVSDGIVERTKNGKFDFAQRSTRLLKESAEDMRFYGQRFGEFYLIFVDVNGVDDFEKSIFEEIRESTGKKIIFVDVHDHLPLTGEKVLLKNDERSERMGKTVFGLLERLEKEEEHQVRAGKSVSDDGSAMALIEDIGGEKYLFITVDRNGLTEELVEYFEKFRDGSFDEVIVLTTDTHESVSFLRDPKESSCEEIQDNVDSAANSMEKVEIGVLEEKMEDLEVMGKDAHVLEASVSFLIHLFLLHLLIIYFSFFLIVL